jgi:hypothetical protein
MKSVKEFWKEKFDEYPQTDADKLSVVMMTEYAREYQIKMDAYYGMLKVLKNIDDCHDVYAPDLGMSSKIFEDVSKMIELAESRV